MERNARLPDPAVLEKGYFWDMDVVLRENRKESVSLISEKEVEICPTDTTEKS
jgi:hypothetical protein